MGAVWSNFLVKPVQALFLYLESRKIFTFHLNNWKIFYLPITVIILTMICQFFINDQNLTWFAAGQLILTSSLVFATYRKELLSLFT